MKIKAYQQDDIWCLWYPRLSWGCWGDYVTTKLLLTVQCAADGVTWLGDVREAKTCSPICISETVLSYLIDFHSLQRPPARLASQLASSFATYYRLHRESVKKVTEAA